jgi:HTH-type transcriptional regulator/antitoxin MqsA
MGAAEMTNCKLCKSEDVSDYVEEEEITYKGSTLQVSIAYSLCNSCDREFISKPQILQNEAALRAAKKDYDGLLSSEEIIRARRTLSLTQEQAARVFGGGRNAFSKYERGEVSQSVAMDKLIRICLNHREVFHELARDITKK